MFDNFEDYKVIDSCINNDEYKDYNIRRIQQRCIAAAEDEQYQSKDLGKEIEDEHITQKLYSRLYNPRIKLSSRINVLKNKLLTVHVNNEAQKRYMEAIFNREAIVNKFPNQHPHMCLAQLRRQFEFEVTLNCAPQIIFDIGAGCRSIKYGLTHVFNNQPILSGADRLRNCKRKTALAIDPFMRLFQCNCPIAECEHIVLTEDDKNNKDKVDPDILLSIDSSYYPTVYDFIVRYLINNQDKTAYLAFHVFDEAVKHSTISIAGSTEGEYSIYKDNVKMRVYGNPCVYEHKIHPLNVLYWQSAVLKDGIYFTVVKAASFEHSKYLLVQAVYAGDVHCEEGQDTATLHTSSVPETMTKSQEEPKSDLKVTEDKSLINLTTSYDMSLMENGYYYKINNGKSVDYYRVVNGMIEACTLIDDYDNVRTLTQVNYRQVISVVDLSRTVNRLLLKKGELTYQDIVQTYVAVGAGKAFDLKYLNTIVMEAVRSATQVCASAAQVLNSSSLSTLNKFKTNQYRQYLGYWGTIKYYINIIFWKMYHVLPAFMVIMAGLFSSLGLLWLVDKRYNIVNYLTSNMFGHAASGNSIINPLVSVLDLVLTYFVCYIIRLFRRPKNITRRIKYSCISADNYPEVSEPLMNGTYEIDGEQVKNATWKHKMDVNLTLDQFLKYKCQHIEQDGLLQVVPEIDGAEEPIIYHVCQATNYCAAKRQVTVVPKPDEVYIARFERWFSHIFESEIKPLLEDFNPDVHAWFNHLPAKKQKSVVSVYQAVQDSFAQDDQALRAYLDLYDINTSTDYEMFVKSEKQLYSDGKAPKNRCICSPNAFNKLVMGPVCWALEDRFKNFRGYCGGASWADLEAAYKRWYDNGLTVTIQLDGSGFDRTQHQCIKDIVDATIYKYVADSVRHVPRDTFLRFALAKERKVVVAHRENNGKQIVKNDGTFKQVGAVFSGSCDTTLMNTLRMACYNRFVMEDLCNLKFTTDYEVKSKGDDTVTVVRPNINLHYVMQNYKSVFVYDLPKSEYVNCYHGLGQIAKYFKIGTIEDIDFCSTETMYCPSVDAFKITRQLKRFVTTSVWSRKATHFNAEQLDVYKYAQYLANKTWMDGMPIFRAFNDLFYTNIIGSKVKTVKGKVRTTFATAANLLRDIDLEYYFPSDYEYTLHIETGVIKPTEQDCYEYLLRKYGWSQSDVDCIESEIKAVEGEKIYSPLLAEITH